MSILVFYFGRVFILRIILRSLIVLGDDIYSIFWENLVYIVSIVLVITSIKGYVLED